MDNRKFLNGMVIFVSGLLFSSASSFLATFALFGTATGFMRGVLDGLAVVAFCVAIVLLIRSRQ
jgi:hypothetical protein